LHIFQKSEMMRSYLRKIKNVKNLTGDVAFCKNATSPRGVSYEEFGLKAGVPIYTQYEENKEMFTFVTNPTVADEIWKNYEP